nr:hypothetical protein [Neorhodopirellula pilleata]
MAKALPIRSGPKEFWVAAMGDDVVDLARDPFAAFFANVVSGFG